MDGIARETLSYQGGQVALTDTHLFVIRGKYLAESLALRHLSDVTAEEAHSFRHRILGLVAGGLLLVPAALFLSAEVVGDLVLPVVFLGRFGISSFLAIFFTGFFGLLFLWGVVRSRRIWWLRVRYGSTRKLIPLPGVERDRLEQFVQVVGKEVEGRAVGGESPRRP